MDNLFNDSNPFEDTVQNTRISIDELYDNKKEKDLKKLAVYKKVLARIHSRIKTTSRQRNHNQFCWFVIPEMMLGAPLYDSANCIAYVMKELKDNGFVIKYTHPNLLFISWKHYIPKYVREQIKKERGIIIDENGNIVEEENTNKKVPEKEEENINNLMMNNKVNPNSVNQNSTDKSKDYKSTNSYKPTGNLIYNTDLLKKVEDKIGR